MAYVAVLVLLLAAVFDQASAQISLTPGNVAASSEYNGNLREWYYKARNAVDGNRDADLRHGSCFHSGSEYKQWLRVDLGADYNVTSVSITNRGDCCGDRLKHFSVFVSRTKPSKNNPGHGVDELCVAVKSLAQGATRKYTCRKPIVGRYVTGYMTHGYLHICEFEVFGTWVGWNF